MWRRPTKTAQEHMEDLRKCHDALKAHPFREHFQDDRDTGTFRSLCKEYRNLIYESTDILIALHYYCSDEPILSKDDLEWVHDFRAFLMVIHNFYIYRNSEGEEREYFDKKDRGCPLTYREILTKTHITDINSVMIFFDMYLGYIHSFIDTGIFNTIAAIEYEPVTSPHSGYYYKHMITLEKVDGVWQPKGEVPYIGTISRQDNNIEGE